MSGDISVVVRLEKKRGLVEAHFATVEPQILFEIQPDADLRELHCALDPVEREISNVVSLSEASTGTEVRCSGSRGQVHGEGGWPNTVDACEPDDRVKYCKKQERDEKYLALCSALAGRMKAALRLNCAVNIFETYFSSGEDGAAAAASNGPSQGGGGGGGASSSSPLTSATPGLGQAGRTDGGGADSSSTSGTKSASGLGASSSAATGTSNRSGGGSAAVTTGGSVSYRSSDAIAGLYVACKMMPSAAIAAGGGGMSDCVLAANSGSIGGSSLRAPQASYGCSSDTNRVFTAYYSQSAALQSSEPVVAACIWHVASPTAPHTVLLSKNGGCTAIAPSPKDQHLLAGGTVTGVVQLWDDRKEGGLPVLSSDRQKSHGDAVTGIRHCATKGIDFFSVGLDGQVLFFDMRRLSGPVEEETVLLTDGSSGTAVAATDVDYDPLVGGIQQYLVAGMDGSVFACSRRARTPSERILNRYQVAYGACNGVQRCPWAPKMFLTVGDWGFKVFGDEVLREPVLTAWPTPAAYFTCGRWHPSRPTIVLTGTSDGQLLLWDITLPLIDPCMALKVADRPIESLQARGNRVVATDKAGVVYAIALPDVVAEPSSANERSALVAMLDREHAKARLLQAQTLAAAAASPTAGLGGTGDADSLFGMGSTPNLGASRMRSRSEVSGVTFAMTPFTVGLRPGGAALTPQQAPLVDSEEAELDELAEAYLSHVLADEMSDLGARQESATNDDSSTSLSGTQKGGEAAALAAAGASYRRRLTAADDELHELMLEGAGGHGHGGSASNSPVSAASPSAGGPSPRVVKPKAGIGAF